MAAQDILPLKIWAAGALNNSIPANDNAIRVEVMTAHAIDVLSSQPESPEDGDQYIIGAAATGSQWAGLSRDTAVIFKGGTWLAFNPFVGWIKTIGPSAYRYAGAEDGWQGFGGSAVPTATASRLGVVSVGSGLQISPEGVLSTADSGGGMDNPMLAQGDIIVGGVDGVPQRLGVGSVSWVLTVNSDGLPTWAAPDGGSGGLPALEEGDMLYAGPGGVLQRIEAGSTGMVLKLAGLSPYWGFPETKTAIPVACSDETTPLTIGLKVTFRLPHDMLFSQMRASLTTASGSGAVAVSVSIGGSSAGSISLAAGLKSATITSGVASANDDTEVTVTINSAGAGATGLKVYLIGTVKTT